MYMLFVAIRFRHEIDIGSFLFCMKMTEHSVINSKIVSNMKYLSNIIAYSVFISMSMMWSQLVYKYNNVINIHEHVFCCRSYKGTFGSCWKPHFVSGSEIF